MDGEAANSLEDGGNGGAASRVEADTGTPEEGSGGASLESPLIEKYGSHSHPQTGHAFLLIDGRWTGNVVHHAPAARFALQQAGIEYEAGYELVEFMRLTGAIRVETGRGALHVQLERDLTPEQLDAIAQATNSFPRFFWDVYAPDGSALHTGEGLLDFLSDSLVADALRRVSPRP